MNQRPIPAIEGKDDTERAFARIEAWYQHQIVDRAPIRFSAHNSEYTLFRGLGDRWPSLRDRWFDAEYQVDSYLASLRGRQFLAETFPVFWPNLGPEVYSAFYGSELTYMEVTAFSVPLVKDLDRDLVRIRFDENSPYLRKLDEMTDLALEKCAGRCLVGYTDLHAGMDCVAAWRDPQELCLDLLENPELVHRLLAQANERFLWVYDRYDAKLKAAGQLSVTWMQIPARGRMHIPSADFSALVSPKLFDEFCLPTIRGEIRTMSHNIFHMDGRGVAKNLDRLLEIPEINAIQWVQGMGLDAPILQWIPLIRRIQAAGKSLVLDLTLEELEPFMAAVRPEGIFLCLSARFEDQPAIIRRVEQW